MTDEIPEVNTQAATVPVAEWLNDMSNWLPESVLPAPFATNGPDSPMLL